LQVTFAQPQPHRRASAHDHFGVVLVERHHAIGEKFLVKEGQEHPDLLVLRREQFFHPAGAILVVEVV